MKRTRASRLAAIAAALNVAEQLLAGQAEFMPHGHHQGYDGVYSARAWMAGQRLLTRADIAAQRDLEARKEGSVWAGGESNAVRSALQTVLSSITRLDHWRHRLLHEAPPRTDQTSPESDTASLALVQFLEYVLTPWFTGATPLNYAALDILEATARLAYTEECIEPSTILNNHPVQSVRVEIIP